MQLGGWYGDCGWTLQLALKFSWTLGYQFDTLAVGLWASAPFVWNMGIHYRQVLSL